MAYNLINDFSQIEKFYKEILGDLEPYEAHFVSLAARDKYLSEDEKKEVDLRKASCMFGRTIFTKHDFVHFKNTLIRLDATVPFSEDANGNFIPAKCMVMYANINPSDTRKAYSEFKKDMADAETELLNAISNNRDSSIAINRYVNLSHTLTTEFQRNRSKKRWIDIDWDRENLNEDIKPEDVKELVVKSFSELCALKCFVIQTKGGFHILISTSSLCFNPERIIDLLKIYYVGNCKEIIINKNEMVPMPGTLQGLFPVRMV